MFVWSKSLASNFTLLYCFRFVLELFSRFELYMHSKALLSRSCGFAQSSLTQTFESKLSPFPSRSAVLSFQKFSGMLVIVIYCLIINVLLLSCDSLVRISQAQYLCQHLFLTFFIFFKKVFGFPQAPTQNIITLSESQYFFYKNKGRKISPFTCFFVPF